MSVPVTIVHGWLDSGADRLAITLARGAGPAAVLVHHGFGDLGIPPDLEAVRVREQTGHRSPGCPCCAVRVDLLDGLGRLLRRRHPPRHVVVLELPGADPATSVVTILEDPDLQARAHLNAVVACLDGPTTAARMATGDQDPWPSPTMLHTTVLADYVWISHGRQLTHDGIRLAASAVRRVNPLATVDASTPRPGPILERDAWSPDAVGRRLDSLPSGGHPAGGQAVGGPGWIGSTLLEVDGSLDSDRVEDWISALHGASGARLLRLEGVLALEGDGRRRHVIGCRTAFRQQPGPSWRVDEHRRSRLRIAGSGLDLRALHAELSDCRA